MSPAASTRWCPTAEQVMILEEMYRCGVRTPNATYIQQITAYLSSYGKIQGKNVFYWFQNHKARDRQKRRKKQQQQQQQFLTDKQQQQHMMMMMMMMMSSPLPDHHAAPNANANAFHPHLHQLHHFDYPLPSIPISPTTAVSSTSTTTPTNFLGFHNPPLFLNPPCFPPPPPPLQPRSYEDTFAGIGNNWKGESSSNKEGLKKEKKKSGGGGGGGCGLRNTNNYDWIMIRDDDDNDNDNDDDYCDHHCNYHDDGYGDDDDGDGDVHSNGLKTLQLFPINDHLI